MLTSCCHVDVKLNYTDRPGEKFSEGKYSSLLCDVYQRGDERFSPQTVDSSLEMSCPESGLSDILINIRLEVISV